MGKEQIFEAWAPAESPWSVWAKPVLFAQMTGTEVPRESQHWEEVDTSWVPNPSDLTALIVDLPGVQSVDTGLALALKGYRPVPLYNCCDGPSPVVAVFPIIRALAGSFAALAEVPLDRNAPPAFLLDADRKRESAPARPGSFDNRWMVFPQDFPSANFLISQSIRSAILVHQGGSQPQDDLAHVLLRWQQAGIQMQQRNPNHGEGLPALEVRQPSMFRSLWYRALAVWGLRRNSAGGFGSIIPQPSSSGHGYG
jgi:hypothetical protein